MQTIASGIDLIEIERLQKALERYGMRLLSRIFTPQEIAEVGDSMASLAARFAAKEAVAKALETGIGEVGWLEIEILRGPNRQPMLSLHGAAARLAAEKGLYHWSISLSHSLTTAIALTVATG